MKVAVTTLGCKTNQYESAAMREMLSADGHELVSFEEIADVYVINTCTVTAKTDAESRRLVRRARKRNEAARVVVTGCYAQVSAAEVEALEGVDLVVGNREKKDISAILKEVGERKVLVGPADDGGTLPLESHAEHTRAFLQVQNGCDSFCSYCIVPYARGRSRSVPLDEAVTAAGRFADKGFGEVVLSGIHLGAYGLDLHPPRELPDLLRAIEAEGRVTRLRLGSVEPQEVGTELIALMAQSKILCPHLHIPLQSGSDTVLERMGRRYAASLFAGKVEALVAAVPDICIGADVIAGFPGETDEEFSETCDFIKRLPLAYLHVFPFSSRPGTPAADMPGHLPPRILKERGEVLRGISEVKKSEFLSRFVGRKLRVLPLRSGDGREGLSRNYIAVTLAGGVWNAAGETEVVITGVSGSSCIGVPEV